MESERETASLSLPLSLLSCLLHACSLLRSLARRLGRSHACNTYIYSCPSPSPSTPSFLPSVPIRPISNNRQRLCSFVGLRPLNGPQFKTTTAAAEEATERPPLPLSPSRTPSSSRSSSVLLFCRCAAAAVAFRRDVINHAESAATALTASPPPASLPLKPPRHATPALTR